MKAPARNFRLSDWYGEDWDHKKPAGDLWVSPWAKAHYKLRQQEIEIEQCEFMLQQAIDNEDYAEADGLKERAERLRSQHPIAPKEQRLVEALEEQNFALAAIFQKDLDGIKKSLGLPRYNVGQAVVHGHREGLRGVVIDADLHCIKDASWIAGAGCLEQGCALDYRENREFLTRLHSQEGTRDPDDRELRAWARQPFYMVIPDLEDMEDEEAVEGTWRWRWPSELAAWEINHRTKVPAPLYLPEEALLHDPDAEKSPTHPELDKLFDGFDTSPHRGRIYRPAPRLRLWQQQRAKEQQELKRRQQSFAAGEKNPYDAMR